MGFFSKNSHYCRTPRNKKGGGSWTCSSCGSRFRWVEPARMKGRGYWLMVKDGRPPR